MNDKPDRLQLYKDALLWVLYFAFAAAVNIILWGMLGAFIEEAGR